MSLFKFIGAESRCYLTFKHLKGLLNEWIIFKILRARTSAAFWGRCVFGRQFIFYAEFYGPVFSGDFAQERFKTFAISLCAQNFHQWFLIRRKTELEIAPFDSEHVGHSCRISQEIFLRWNLYAELFPNSYGIDISARF